MELTQEILTKIIDTSNKVDLMWTWMKAGGGLILAQIVITVFGIARNGKKNGKT